MGGSRHARARARRRALSAAPAMTGHVVQLSDYAGRDAPAATLTRWRGENWSSLEWSTVVAYMQTAEQSGNTVDWARLTRRMYQDGHLLSLRGSRIDPVAGADFDVAPGGPSEADAQAARDVDAMLRSLPDLPTLLDAVLDAEFVGWSAQEIIWGVRGAWVWPDEISILEPHRFRFDRLIRPYLWDDGRLGNAPGSIAAVDMTGMPLRENKFIVHLPRVIPDYAIASGLLRACVRYWWVKWTAAAYNLAGAEVAGNPRMIGKYPASVGPGDTTDAVRQSMWDQMQSLSGNGAMLLPSNAELQILNASAQGSSSIWSSLLSWADDGMTKAVLGSTLNVDIGAIGSKAAAESQATTTIHPRLRKSATSMWATLRRDLIRPFIEFNLWRYGDRMPALPVVSTRFQEDLEAKPSDVLIDVGAVTIDELRKRDGLPEWGPERGGNAIAKRAATGGWPASGMAGGLAAVPSQTDFVGAGGARAADPFKPWDLVARMTSEAE